MQSLVDVHHSTFIRIVGMYIVGVLLLLFAGSLQADAVLYGRGSYGTCQFGTCTITLTSSTTIAANVTPGGSTTCTVVKDEVSVRTGSSSGYSLQVNDADADTALNRSGGGAIAAVSGSRSSPVTLTANKWGYRVDGIAGFGAGPTTAASNVTVPALSFSAVPAFGSSDVIAIKTSAANVAEITPVWYGLCSNTSIPTGSYGNTVVYTAITN